MLLLRFSVHAVQMAWQLFSYAFCALLCSSILDDCLDDCLKLINAMEADLSIMQGSIERQGERRWEITL